MANQFNAGTPAKVQTLMNAIRTALGNVDMDLKDSVGMKVTLTVSNDGTSVVLDVQPSDQGQSNRLGAAEPSGRLAPIGPKIIPVSSLP